MKNILQQLLAIVLCTFLHLTVLQGQSLNADGDLHEVNYNGTYQDFTIPSGANLNGSNYITFFLKGADGGKSNGTYFVHRKAGGGATVEADLEIGSGPGQLKPGGTLRIIVGKNGTNGRGGGYAIGGGGGGGTAVLYLDPNGSSSCNNPSLQLSDAASCWVILAVAGGGGGASEYEAGRNGKTNESGGSGNSNGNGGAGGSNGAGGGAGGTAGGGGGGGYSGNGGGGTGRGDKGGFTGGEGGSGNARKRKGGYGYGGGGSGSLTTDGENGSGGGGAGGFSGGGGADVSKAGGGGGSFVNNAAIENNKERGEHDNTPNNGRFYYEFSIYDPTKPKAKCKNIEVTLNSGSYTLAASEIDDGSIADPGETIVPAILKKIAGQNVPVFSITLDCSDIGEKLVTLQVISTSGKKDKCAALVQVVDDVAPNVSCGTPFPIVATVTRGQEFVLDPELVIQSSSDACGHIIDKYFDKGTFTCEDVGSNTVTLYVEDESGNLGSCNFTFTLGQDTEALSLSCPADGVANIGLPGCVAELDEDILTPDLTGPCSSSLTYEISDGVNIIDSGSGIPIGNTLAPGTYTLSYTHSANGTTANCSFNISVEDPGDGFDLFCPGSFEIELPEAVNCSVPISSSFLQPTTGFCGTINGNITYQIFNSISGNTISGAGVLGNTDFKGGTNTVTYFLGENTCSFTIEVIDNVPPTAFCNHLTVQLDNNCEATVDVTDLAVGSDDNCVGITALAYYQDCSEIPCTEEGPVSFITYTTPGDYDVIVEVTDASGNTTDCSALVSVETPMVMPTCQDITRSLDANGEVNITPQEVYDASSASCVAPTSMNLSDDFFTCLNIGANTVTLIAEYENNNLATCTATVTIADNMAPVALCLDFMASLTSDGTRSILPHHVFSALSSDNCSAVTPILVSPSVFTCADLGANTVTLTVADESGNQSTCTATVTIDDPSSPLLMCADPTITLDESGLATVTLDDLISSLEDECETEQLAYLTSEGPSQPMTSFNFNCDNLGENEIFISATDLSGNTTTCLSYVTIADDTPPVANCQQSLTLTLDENGQATLTPEMIDNNSSDNCGNVQLMLSQTNFDCSQLGLQTVVLTATDNNDNEGTCNATILVKDVIPPVALCANATVQLDESGMISITHNVIDNDSWDNCGNFNFSLSQSDFTCDEMGTQSVTLTTTDDSGNSSSCIAYVTVEDNIAPTANCKIAKSINLNENGQATLTPAMIDNNSFDNCGDITLEFGNGTTEKIFDCDQTIATVTLRVTDGSGNQSTCSTVVFINDHIAPNAVCQDITAQLDENGSVIVTNGQLDGGTTDNCTSSSLGFFNFDCEDIGENTVNVNFSDFIGNSSSCQATVTVEDNIAPTAVCQNITVNLSTPTLTSEQLDGGSSDNCTAAADLTFETTSSTVECADVGDQTVTLTVSDASENSSSCSATVVVIDDIPPVAQCQSELIKLYLDESGQVNLTTDMLDDNSTDNCGNVSLSFEDGSTSMTFGCSDVFGIQEVELLVSDDSGNQSTCTASVLAYDNIAPNAICQDITIELGADGTVSVEASQIDGGSYDNCDNGFNVYGGGLFDCGDLGETTVELEAEDIFGYYATCNAIVTIVDNTPPTMKCQDITVQLGANGVASIMPDDVDNGSHDVCGIASLSVVPNNFTCADIGSHIVTLTATDHNGNSSTCTITATVEDNNAPVILACQGSMALFNGEEEFSAASLIDFDATSPCGIMSVTYSPEVITCVQIGQTIPVTVTVTDNNGNSNTCIADVETSGLPCGYTDFGDDGIDCEDSSNVEYDADSGSFTLTSDGCTTINFSQDNAAYVQSELCGNGEIIAHVTNINPLGQGWAGITMRESEAPGAKKVELLVNLSNFIRRAVRTVTNGVAFPGQLFRPQATWLKIKRTGNQFRGYASTNGSNWQAIMAVYVPMNACIQAGLMVTNYSPNTLVTGSFDNVTINTSGSNTNLQMPDTDMGTMQQTTGLDFNLFPNPAKEKLYLEIIDPQSQEVRVEVLNQLGQPILTRQLSNNLESFDLNAMQSGTYFIRVITDQEERVKKFLIVK